MAAGRVQEIPASKTKNRKLKNIRRMGQMGRQDFYVAIFLLVFCGLAYGVSYPYPHASAYFPHIIILLLAIMSGALLGKSILEGRKEKIAADRTTGVKGPSSWKKEGARKVILMLAVFILYLLVMSSVGFYLTTFIYLPVMIWLLGVRKIKVVVLSTFFVLIFIYLVFSAFLKVPIPEGILF
jgi:putative tricarboxylic transport membrane protein